jgi:hypothetical protein
MTINKKIKLLSLLLLTVFSITTSADGMDNTSPQYCGACHQRIFKEWSSSRMGQDLNNQKVYQFYAGVSGSGEKDGIGYQPMMHGKKGDCADCHVPMLVLSEHKKGKEVDLGIAMQEKKDHGISCIFCHSVKDVHINKDADGKYKTRIFDTVTLGDMNTRYGPLKDAKSPVHKTEYKSHFKDSSLCGTCHLNQEKFLSISQYDDWKKAYDSGVIKETCQECHMPLIEGETIAAIGGPKRKGMRKHTFVGAYDLGMLKKALSLDLSTEKTDGKLIVKTIVTNVGAGHKVPGSGPIRNVILKIEATDDEGKPLKFAGDKRATLPPLAGFGNPKTKVKGPNDWIGLPGKMYAKAYKSKVIPKMGKAMVGVGGFLADSVLFDTAIKPKESDTMKFAFELPSKGKVHIKARLVYRDAFKPLSDMKGWKLEQRPMTEASTTIDLLAMAPVDSSENKVSCITPVFSVSNVDKMSKGDFSPNVLFKDVGLTENSIGYGPGANHAYEVTIVDGKIFMASPEGEKNIKVRHKPIDQDGAAMLQIASPKKWINAGKLEAISSFDDLNFALEGIAEDNDCGDDALLPFKIVGHANTLTWSMDTEHPRSTDDKDIDVEIVGLFTAEDKQKYFMVKGYNIHPHVVLTKKDQAGHMRTVDLQKGATLYLPGE